MGADKTFRNAYDLDSDWQIWSKNSKYCKSVAENINRWIKYEIMDEGELFLVLQEDDQYWPCSFHSVFKCDVERTHMDEWKSDKINISLSLSLPWLAELIWNFQRKACDTLVIYWYVSVCQEHEFYTLYTIWLFTYLTRDPYLYVEKICHVDKFQISPHLSCGEIWNVSTFQMWRI